MATITIIKQGAVSLRRKKLDILIENDNGQRRRWTGTVPIDLSFADLSEAQLSAIWQDSVVVDDDVYEMYARKDIAPEISAIMRRIIREMRNATSLADVSDTIEDVVGNDSAQDQRLTKLKSLAAGATAAERDRFFMLMAFLSLSRLQTE